jgi:hypothetical protein
MKEPFESGFTAYRLFDLPNFVRRGVSKQWFLYQVLDNIKNMLWKKNERTI